MYKKHEINFLPEKTNFLKTLIDILIKHKFKWEQSLVYSFKVYLLSL